MRRTALMWALALLVIAAPVALGAHLSDPYPVGPNSAVGVSGGPEVVIADGVDLGSGNPASPGRIDLSTSAGDITLASPGDTRATLDRITGAWTNVSAVDASGGELMVDPGDKLRANVTGGVDSLAFRNASLDDSAAFVHTSSSSGTVEVGELPAGAEWVAASSGGADVDSGTADADGFATVSVSSASGQVVHLAQAETPVVDAPSADPTGDQADYPDTLYIDVSDADFSKTIGDELTVEFTLNGDTVGSETLTSNGTATATDFRVVGGRNTWGVTVEDEYGNQVESEQFVFNAPSDLDVRQEVENATGAHPLIDSDNATVEFYFDRGNDPDLVEERDATGGTINMTGLPTDEPFVVVAQADGFYNRRIFVESLYESQNVYMLNSSVEAVQPTFGLTDFTGDFPRETTVLMVQRNIDNSWQPVEGDFFGGANQMGAQLEFNKRYRLVLLNTETGERRDMGVYTPTQSSFVDIEVFQDDRIVSMTEAPHAMLEPGAGTLPSRDGVEVEAQVDSGDKDLESYDIELSVNGTVLATASGSSSNGSAETLTADLSGYEGQEAVVEVSWTAADGTTGSEGYTYVVREAPGSGYGVLTILVGLGGSDAPNMLTSLITVFAAILATGVAAPQMGSGNAGLAGLGVITVGAVVGFIPFQWVVGAAMAWVVVGALVKRI